MRDNKHRARETHPSHSDQEDSQELLDLAEKEQRHRHKWQDNYLKASSSSFRAGQIFGLIYNLALLYFVYDLVQNGDRDLAIKIFALNVGIIAFALLVTSIERRVFSKKSPPRKNNSNRGKGDRSRDVDKRR